MGNKQCHRHEALGLCSYLLIILGAKKSSLTENAWSMEGSDFDRIPEGAGKYACPKK